MYPRVVDRTRNEVAKRRRLVRSVQQLTKFELRSANRKVPPMRRPLDHTVGLQRHPAVLLTVLARDDAITKRRRRAAALILPHRESRHALLGHVHAASIPFRRDEDVIRRGAVDRLRERRVEFYERLAAGEFALADILEGRLARIRVYVVACIPAERVRANVD